VGLWRVIGKAEKQLSALGPLIRENQQAITTLTYLQRAGFSQKDVKELVALVSIWNKSMVQGNGISNNSMNGKLDTELIDVGTQMQPNNGNGNLQQSGSSNPGSNNCGNGNNGHGVNGNFSTYDLIKLNLKSSTTTMLNRMGIK
jgi:hypothetical protein